MTRCLIPCLLLFSILTCHLPWSVSAQQVGFLETFALSQNRGEVLDELVPGTDEYYLFHSLHLQNNGEFDKAESMLQAWIKRRGENALNREIRNRQALLTYDLDSDATIQYLTKQLGLRFNHQRKRPTSESGLATGIDDSLISYERLKSLALKRKDTKAFEDVALPGLGQLQLNDSQLRDLLTRLTYPAMPNLPALINRDLAARDARPFGSYPIHAQLLLSQLDELLELRPSLRNQDAFIGIYLSKLRPGNDVDMQVDRAALVDYLDRLWEFVATLEPVHNSLKVNVLYQQLKLDRSEGTYDKGRFLEYLKLPRQAIYMPRKRIREVRSNRHLADMQKRCGDLPAVINDEPLVRDYLHHFLVEAQDLKEFSPWVENNYLKERFAEAKITAGKGDGEQWASWLNPSKYQALIKRVDLEFSPTNPRLFPVDQPVEIKLTTKNVRNLIVKVFEINTRNYYRKNQNEINTNINLDGLVANWQKTFEYTDAPALRTERTFRFDEIDHRGVFIVDFIGNGKSSRMLVRKGELKHLVETTPAGQVFRVFNENRKPLLDASVWIAGVQYDPDEKGRILIPFSNQPQKETAVIEHGGFSSRAMFDHQSENWQLKAGLFVDREMLRRMGKAEILIRPQLLVAGLPASLEFLEKPRLIVRATDWDGIPTTKEFLDLDLSDALETRVEIIVPNRLRKIELELIGEIDNVSRGQKQQLVVNRAYEVNAIDLTEQLQTVHLSGDTTGYFLSVRDKSGAAQAAQVINAQFKHRLFKEPVSCIFQTDERGLVRLGGLKDIEWLRATPSTNQTQQWALNRELQTDYQSRHAKVGETLKIPFDNTDDLADFILLEICGNQFVRDVSGELSFSPGLISIEGLAAGDYALIDRWKGTRQLIRITQGVQEGRYLMGASRVLEVRNSDPIRVSSVSAANDKVQIQIDGKRNSARVHVIARNFEPRFDWFAEMSRIRDVEPLFIRESSLRSNYIEGRTLGEEYQYILDRQLQAKYPGNMLERPSLLLNPWSIQATENRIQQANQGEAFDDSEVAEDGFSKREASEQTETGNSSDFATLDFLAEGSVLLFDLPLNDSGQVEFDRSLLGDKSMVQILVQNQGQTISRNILLPPTPVAVRNLKLVDPLDPNQHFSSTKQQVVINAEQTFELENSGSAKFKTFDELKDVYQLFISLTGDAQLRQFEFLMDWPNLTPQKKEELYKKHACHELHFFLMKKDPDFFKTQVLPFLKNKLHPTFFDDYLTEAPLKDWGNPWEFEQLNTFERILLSERLPERRERLRQGIADAYEARPVDRRASDRWVTAALRNNEMDADEKGVGLAAAALPQKTAVPSNRRETLGRATRGRRSKAAAMGGGGGGGLADKAMPSESDATREFADDFAGGLGGRAGEQAPEQQNLEFKVDELRDRRKNLSQLYRRIKPTQEWVESNYYKIPTQRKTADRVQTNQFWRDYAVHDKSKSFLSPYFVESSRNFTEMLFALSVLDLPFKAEDHSVVYENNAMKFTPKSNLLAYFEQVRNSKLELENANILVSENFFQNSDRFRVEGGVKREKFVRDEFLPNMLYGGQIVMTNPTATPLEVDLLIQIPEGSLPANGSHETRTNQINLKPFSTERLEYYFYFPSAGDYSHFPAHLSMDSNTVAVGKAMRFNVVDKLTKIDKSAWAWLSQNGTEQEVLDYLSTQNLELIALDQIAFRMHDADFFQKAIGLLRDRFVFDSTLWSYALKHRDLSAINEYLQHREAFVNACGLFLKSKLLTIQPVLRRLYEHREYWPLVNARAHQLGNERKILNNSIANQYQRLLQIVARQAKPGGAEQLAVTYYLILQDRIAEALSRFEMVQRSEVNMKLQYDYCDAYLAMYREQPQRAREIATAYIEFPVQRWRERFDAILAQVAEIDGEAPRVVDTESERQRQVKAASEVGAFQFVVESLKTRIQYQNLDQVVINYYQMDVELLFSRNPFVKKQDDSFAMIQPNFVETVALPANQTSIAVDLPEQFRTSNVLVEVVGAGKTERQAYYANSMDLQMVQQMGQLKVSQQKSGQPLSKVYVKVYARKSNGSVQFYKDGYTDLRGRFDYVSLSNQGLGDVERFAILVVSPEFGAIVQEADVPKQ